ncbi:uncharacterized protein LOC107624739 [Arachis ipaensis]|uniref:uncharacterized protein LOC107624739 n=1 Tax=Arachis ipaensis TaxID=130454 RepID=UPI0007AEEF43|nr:uncharacterized protein LOC107624739 [Arachis ipaensis]
MELQRVESAYESQKRLHGYLKDVHARSLWGKFYPFSVMADELCCFPDDMKMIDEVGHVGTSHFLQVIGACIVAVERAQELALERERKVSLDIAELCSAVQEKEKTIAELSYSLSLKEAEFVEERSLQLASAEQVKTVKGENNHLESRIKELEHEVYEAFAQGFDRAVSQVKVLFPESDVTKLDATKVVVNDQLMDDEAADGDDSKESSIGDKAD